ncbi:MAG TPA: ElyC/SanA/YdcF family protein, partial [Verrucomicrobiales bacterium]|nr:ElyC/SanA/YdcF family protein [Verrucomicrobiales bacterium]
MHRLLQISFRWSRRAAWVGAILVLLVVGLNLWMTLRAGSRIETDAAKVPETDVALVLGTGKIIGGGVNVHFTVRMDSAAALYKAGRVKHFLLSGDNSRAGYNEPEDMKAALVERGVPAGAMTCDYAGFRTLDSVIRAKEIFGITRCIVISDDFHLARALWLADRNGISATAFYAEAVSWENSWRPRCREWLA